MNLPRRITLLSALAAVTLAACGGEKSPDAGAGQAAPQVAAVSFDASKITPAQIALGDSIFHGKIGASSCQACHGVGGQQGTVAPILSDKEWLHGDGSLEFIYNTIKTGVMAPKQYSSVMPPYGGVMMTPERTLAVAAYVYSISHE